MVHARVRDFEKYRGVGNADEITFVLYKRGKIVSPYLLRRTLLFASRLQHLYFTLLFASRLQHLYFTLQTFGCKDNAITTSSSGKWSYCYY